MCTWTGTLLEKDVTQIPFLSVVSVRHRVDFHSYMKSLARHILDEWIVCWKVGAASFFFFLKALNHNSFRNKGRTKRNQRRSVPSSIIEKYAERIAAHTSSMQGCPSFVSTIWHGNIDRSYITATITPPPPSPGGAAAWRFPLVHK